MTSGKCIGMVIKKSQIIFSVLIVVGLLFRSVYPSHYVFGFDQVQILANAEKIAQGDLTLIGPRTGPAEMFTGPLIYYLTAILSFIIPIPWTIVPVSVMIAFMTGVVIFWVTKKYLSTKVGLVALAIWSFSPFLIHFDRITWNPNLTLLASFLTFIPLTSIVKSKKANKTDLIFIFLGSFLGYQAHFSGLFLPALAIGTLIFFKVFNFKVLFTSMLGVALSLLPTFIFDLRNDWLNAHGFLNFLSNKGVVSSTPVLTKFFESLQTSYLNLGRILFFHLNKETVVFAGAGILIFSFGKILMDLFAKKASKDTGLQKISLTWIFLTALIFSFYTQNPPEYYFFISLPAMIMLVACLLLQFSRFNINNLIIILLLALYMSFKLEAFTNKGHLQLGQQLNIINDIKILSLENNISDIIYDYKPDIDHIGFQYLIKNQVSFSDNGQKLHIVKNATSSKKYGTFGLWVDPRTKLDANYLSYTNIVIETPLNISLLESRDEERNFNDFQVYFILENNQNLNDKLVIARKITDLFDDNRQVYTGLINSIKHNANTSPWNVIDYLQYQGYVQEQENFLIIYLPENLNKVNLDLLSQIKSFDVTPRVLY